MDKILIAPSTDPIKTVEGIINYTKIIETNADLLHCDIMDGRFVDKVTYSFDVLKEIKNNTLLPLDVHLMMQKPSKKIKHYIKAGANIITIHYEAYNSRKKLIKDLKMIRKIGALSGLSIKPNTIVYEIFSLLSYCDLVLVMSVEPGKSGQSFIKDSFNKISELNKIREDNQCSFKIEVDGGVNPEVAIKLKSLGANILVSGNYVYSSEDKNLAILNLK